MKSGVEMRGERVAFVFDLNNEFEKAQYMELLDAILKVSDTIPVEGKGSIRMLEVNLKDLPHTLSSHWFASKSRCLNGPLPP
jgi:hypothetical protein